MGPFLWGPQWGRHVVRRGGGPVGPLLWEPQWGRIAGGLLHGRLRGAGVVLLVSRRRALPVCPPRHAVSSRAGGEAAAPPSSAAVAHGSRAPLEVGGPG